MSDPELDEDKRQTLVDKLMSARRDVKHFKTDPKKLKTARAKVHAAKVALGERGPVWWTDNAGCLMVNTVFELGKIDAPVREVVDNYRKIFINHFEACLRHEGLPDVEAKAEFLLGVLWGILSHIRLAGSNKSAAPMAHVAINTIRSWRQ